MTALIYGIPIVISAIVAYLLGSINTAIIVTKIVTKGGNIKEMGSGNAGFTNVLRSVGKVPAVITIVCDFLKAVVASLLAMGIFALGTKVLASAFDYTILSVYSSYLPENGMFLYEHRLLNMRTICTYIAGYCCILGHMFPIYFKFKGGKGVVAAIGMIAILDWRVFLIILGVFLIIFLLSKIISLGSLICAFLYGPVTFLITYFLDYKQGVNLMSLSDVIIISVIALIAGWTVIIKHHENIGRLIRGEEKKIKAKK
jgi:glycerol-3-phosphate acyltransferase PlsY